MIRHHQSLVHDLALDRTLAAARRRRNGRRIGNGAAMTAALAAALALALHQPAPDVPATATSTPPPTTAAETKPKPAIPACHRITSDDELLDVLADQGPMLVTATDGQRYLVITRPN